MRKLTTTQQLAAKTLAMEVVLLALLREKRGDTAFWARVDRVMQLTLTLDGLATHQQIDVRQMADSAQDFLDTWREIAGQNPNDPAPPGSGPFDPSLG